ncbi:hypothetical protein RRG08_036530 [Elysia crispata]|uniref:Uncharacterized protein n=1 Tax=Elysia crispata TaxID=231223 RepID=A0AAE0YW32_9GAST|nr:hypothetical protein RRG08_036530 [Elysia crispata]
MWGLAQLLAKKQIEKLTWVLTQLFSKHLLKQLMWVLVSRWTRLPLPEQILPQTRKPIPDERGDGNRVGGRPFLSRCQHNLLASPQLPDQVIWERSRIPVRQNPLEPIQPSQVDASRDRMSSTPTTLMELRRFLRLAQR